MVNGVSGLDIDGAISAAAYCCFRIAFRSAAVCVPSALAARAADASVSAPDVRFRIGLAPLLDGHLGLAANHLRVSSRTLSGLACL